MIGYGLVGWRRREAGALVVEDGRPDQRPPPTPRGNRSRSGSGTGLTTPTFFAGHAALKALIGAATWLLVLAALGDRSAAAFGASAAALQLVGLLGGAGLPVVVLGFSAAQSATVVIRLSLWGGALGGCVVALGLLVVGVPQISGIGPVLFVAMCPLAVLVVIIDAGLGARGHWGAVGLRLGEAALMRLGLLGLGAVTGAEVMVVAAAVVPEAASASWVLVRHPELAGVVGRVQLPAGLGRYVATQYVSALATFGSVLSVPLVASASMPVATRAEFFPAWAAVAMVFAATHASASAKLIPTTNRSGGRSALFSAPLLASGAILATAVLLGAAASALDWAGWGGRPPAVAGSAALLLGATALWPLVATWMTQLRRARRNVATAAVAAPMLFAPAALVVAGPGLTIAHVAIAWAAALTLSGASAIALRWTRSLRTMPGR